MGKLFSYVVHHDFGLSPNPSGGLCTLAFCKFSHTGKRPNVVELAQKGDWVIGTGGASRLSVGRGKLVYAMRVSDKMTLRDYFTDARFRSRDGNDPHCTRRRHRFALVSDHFFYFGENAPPFARRHLLQPIEKNGQGYRSKFDDDFIRDFERWLLERYDRGIRGLPAAEHSEATWVKRLIPCTAGPSRRLCRALC